MNRNSDADQLLVSSGRPAGDLASNVPHLQVIDAFRMPLVQWDQARKRFYRSARAPSLFPPATGKARFSAARLEVIEQSVRRSALCAETALCAFSGPASTKVRLPIGGSRRCGRAAAKVRPLQV